MLSIRIFSEPSSNIVHTYIIWYYCTSISFIYETATTTRTVLLRWVEFVATSRVTVAFCNDAGVSLVVDPFTGWKHELVLSNLFPVNQTIWNNNNNNNKSRTAYVPVWELMKWCSRIFVIICDARVLLHSNNGDENVLRGGSRFKRPMSIMP